MSMMSMVSSRTGSIEWRMSVIARSLPENAFYLLATVADGPTSHAFNDA
jgi:hypothetical protein